MSTVIEVSELSKSFTILHENRERYTALRDVLTKKAKKIFSFPGWKSAATVTKEEFWALKNINFQITDGDRVGIIGRNGAGKSTLLKILSRITEPTSGRIGIKGKVASLLEVGTGFHPELTGRENIFLNGAILGMSQNEIRKHFDAIVDFAEIEKFLDTPVKRYSSGMYVRLAFAVAAHLEPDILIVDEVLAVGDAQFQKKCLAKMEDVSTQQGRTVLFVSHNIAAIKSLCSSAIILHKGEKILQGSVNDSLAKYLSFDQSDANSRTMFMRDGIPAGKRIFLQEAALVDDAQLSFFRMDLTLKIYSSVSSRISVNLKLKDELGFPLAFGCTNYFIPELYALQPGENTIKIRTEELDLAIGKFKLGIELVIPGVEVLDLCDDCIQFEIRNDGIAKRHVGVIQSWGYGASEIKFQRIDQ